MLTNLERFNGVGYANKGVPSAYVWSGTDQYKSGKYVADGVYDPNKVDAQLGVAGLILTMMQLDPSIKFDGPAPQAQTKPVSATPSAQPVRDGIWLQNSLNRLGATPKLVLDGIVGPATRNAVRAFQLAAGIGVDGLVGPATFKASMMRSLPASPWRRSLCRLTSSCRLPARRPMPTLPRRSGAGCSICSNRRFTDE
jgi:hypothetical protein